MSQWRTIESAPKNGVVIWGVEPESGNRALLTWNGQSDWEIVDYRGQPIGIGFYPKIWLDLTPPTQEPQP